MYKKKDERNLPVCVVVALTPPRPDDDDDGDDHGDDVVVVADATEREEATVEAADGTGSWMPFTAQRAPTSSTSSTQLHDVHIGLFMVMMLARVPRRPRLKGKNPVAESLLVVLTKATNSLCFFFGFLVGVCVCVIARSRIVQKQRSS